MPASVQLDEITNPQFKALCEKIVQTMETLHVPGLALGILHGDQEHTAGLGVTHIEHPLPVTPDTLFQIGSITKTFTGTAVMRLVEQGKLDLDAPVRTYLPDLRLADEAAATGATMRHLLTHTGGWFGDYFDDLGWGDDTLANMVSQLHVLPQQTALGESWAYNNAGFYIAGRVLEVVAEKPFEAAVQELILDPLGMEMSFFFANDVLTHRFAVGHIVTPEQTAVARPWTVGRAAHPAGGLASTVHDLFRYARFHLGDGTAGDGTRLLKPESLAAMQSDQVITRGQDAVGLSWWMRQLQGARIVEHGGGTNGQISRLLLVPEHNFALVVLTNANRGGELINQTIRWALESYLGVQDPPPEETERTEAELQTYVGHYRNPMAEAELYLQDGVLIAQFTPKGGFPTKDSPAPPAPPPARLAFYHEHHAFIPEGPLKDTYCDFMRAPDGRVAWLRAGRLYEKTPGEA